MRGSIACVVAAVVLVAGCSIEPDEKTPPVTTVKAPATSTTEEAAGSTTSTTTTTTTSTTTTTAPAPSGPDPAVVQESLRTYMVGSDLLDTITSVTVTGTYAEVATSVYPDADAVDIASRWCGNVGTWFLSEGEALGLTGVRVAASDGQRLALADATGCRTG